MDFLAGATVTFDGLPATNVVVTPTHIFCDTPAHASGAVDVVVTNPDSQSSTLVGGFTYASTLLVAVGTNIVATSPDGFVWTLGTIPVSTYTSIVWNGSTFVAMGGRVATSPDGITWTQQPVIPGSQISTQVNALAWSPSAGLFVAPSSGGTLTSPDGIVWTRQTGVGNAAGAIAGLLVQVAGGSALSSPDGVTWTLRTFSAASGLALAFDGSIVVAAVSAAGALTKRTADGITWNNGGNTGVNGNTSIAWGPTPGVFVILGAASPPQPAFTSPDGVAWTARAIPDGNWKSVCWDGTKFVAVGLGSIVATSPDGVNWTMGTMAVGNWTAVASQMTIFP
jgi:hypothetical protein